MIIRKLENTDIEQHNMVSSQSFVWRVNPETDNKLPSALVLGAFAEDNKTLMADIEADDFSNFYQGGTLGCAAVGGVASKPEFRRMGAVRRVFDYLFEISPQYGWDISILYPFSTSYYRKFGYETAGHVLSAQLDFAEFSGIERSSSVEIYDGSQLDALLRLYNSIAKKSNLAFCRTNSRYFPDKPYESARYTYIWKNSAGEYRAYATFSVNRDGGCVNVQEIGFLDKEAMLGILGFLRCYDGNQKRICFEKLPLDTPLFETVSNDQKVERRYYNMGAVRILSLENVLAKKRWPDERGHFVFQCEDSIERNNGVFEIEYQSSTAHISKSNAAPDICFDAAAASRILLTGVTPSPEKLEYIPGVKLNKYNPDFFRAFAPEGAFFCDGF